MNGNERASSVMLCLVNEVMRAATLAEADADGVHVPVEVFEKEAGRKKKRLLNQ